MSSNEPQSALPACWTFLSSSEDTTDRLGRVLADVLRPGDVLALVGNLGAGKTRLVQALAAAAGCAPGEVTSPTFILVQEYAGRWPIYHFDTYRLHGCDDFCELGAEEYLTAHGVCCIEWADRVAAALPADHLRVEIDIVGETAREYRFSATGPRGREIVQQLSGAAA